MERVLYVGTKNASSWSLRAWLALREQRIPFEERLIDIRRPQRAEELARVAKFSPPGAVPVLVEGDTVIFDSLAIMEYASEIGERPLLPQDAHLRARARALMAWMHAGLSNLCAPLSFESTFYPTRPPMTEAVRREGNRIVAVWSDELTRHGGPYLVGDLSLADLAFVPTVRRLQAHGIDLGAKPHVSAWAERLMHRPTVLEWMREAEALPPVILEE
ncbi:glutathione S-transferase family protein [Pendulispora brunnea]|uniref:Glutathione S-transferase family protein n=1 Tax=Pendulispora brunnea TaxID=2905690 RepID=A0ABZ2KG52_9BACT